MNRMSAAVARAPNELKSDNEMISRVEKLKRGCNASSSSRDVNPEAAVVRLGQDAVRGEHCGEGIAGVYLPGDVRARCGAH